MYFVSLWNMLNKVISANLLKNTDVINNLYPKIWSGLTQSKYAKVWHIYIRKR